jgi:filamentous hemagglutinin family protein
MKHSVHKLLRLSWKLVMAGLVLSFSALTKAEVTLDGTLGPASSLAGPHFVIPDTVGQTVGTNLFHSFGLFNINTGESATFTGPAAIDNVISRVTGGSQSFIDGPLRSEIQSANFWFINPSGVLFGQHASLDIQGSFHVSTADYLKLGDGGRFEATNPENSVLTVAPPEAFGFLGERQPAGIAVQGSFLKVPDGETLSVVGGDIRIADGTLYAPGGRIDMASVASKGEVVPNAPGQTPDLEVASFEKLGKIEISHSSAPRPEINGLEIANVDTSGEGGGSILIRGGQFVMNHSTVFADNWGAQDGFGGIDIQADTVSLQAGSNITANVLASGRGGNISIETDSLELMDFSAIANGSPTFFDDEGNLFDSSGNVGTIEIKARDTIKMSSDSFISTLTEGEGDAGNISIEAGSLELMDGSGIFLDSQTGFFTRGPPGNAGTIEIKVRDTIKISDSSISTSTMSEGDAGNISIEAGSLELLSG